MPRCGGPGGWVRVGSGWVSPGRYGQAIEEMAQHATAAGRTDRLALNGLNVWCGVSREHLAPRMELVYQTPYERFEKWSPAGPPDQIADFLAPYVEAGCSLFNLIMCARTHEEEVEAAAAVRERLLEVAR